MIRKAFSFLILPCLAIAVVGLMLNSGSMSAAAVGSLPDPLIDTDRTNAKGSAVAVLAGGCFWCTEAVFEQLAGVENVVSGYAGGDPMEARYDLVSEGKTNHTESVEITYDPAKITYGQILKVFFGVAHDSTQLNRQGPDYGRQYRSAIFHTNEQQKRVAEAYIAQLGREKVFSKPIVTELQPLKGFYPAEKYHQDFVRRNPRHPYVVANALPKLKKLQTQLAALLK